MPAPPPSMEKVNVVWIVGDSWGTETAAQSDPDPPSTAL